MKMYKSIQIMEILPRYAYLDARGIAASAKKAKKSDKIPCYVQNCANAIKLAKTMWKAYSQYDIISPTR